MHIYETHRRLSSLNRFHGQIETLPLRSKRDMALGTIRVRLTDDRSVPRRRPADAIVSEHLPPDENDLESLVLTRREVGQKASKGLFFIASTGAILLVVGFAGNLVLARLLTPSDFGIIALGLIVISLATTLADGGLAAALIRRETPPTRGELRSLTGLQLLITIMISAVSVAVALNFGEAGLIASVMIVTLPLSAFQIAGRVTIIRNLEFWRTSITDMIAMIAFYAWSITAAALGAGAWSMATGTVVRTIVATVAIVILSPLGLTLPARPRIRSLLPEIRFGIRFQLSWIVNVIREQLTNTATAVIAGVVVLGQWTLAARLMQLPMLLFQSVWQVSYPAMAHLLTGGHDPKPILEDAARLASVAAVLVLAPFAAAAPVLITPVFGAQWDGVSTVLPLTCLSLLLVGPISVAATGYLNAANRPGDMLRVMSYSTAVSVPLALVLLPVLGIVAIGISLVVNAIVEAILLDRYVRSAAKARLLVRTVLPLGIGIGAAAIAIAFSHTVATTIPWAVATASIAFGLTAAGLALGCPSDLRATFDVCRSSVRNAFARRGQQHESSIGAEALADRAGGLVAKPQEDK
jgi:O-antigen/teichoic acid export membrane protein